MKELAWSGILLVLATTAVMAGEGYHGPIDMRGKVAASGVLESSMLAQELPKFMTARQLVCSLQTLDGQGIVFRSWDFHDALQLALKEYESRGPEDVYVQGMGMCLIVAARYVGPRRVMWETLLPLVDFQKMPPATRFEYGKTLCVLAETDERCQVLSEILSEQIGREGLGGNYLAAGIIQTACDSEARDLLLPIIQEMMKKRAERGVVHGAVQDFGRRLILEERWRECDTAEARRTLLLEHALVGTGDDHGLVAGTAFSAYETASSRWLLHALSALVGQEGKESVRDWIDAQASKSAEEPNLAGNIPHLRALSLQLAYRKLYPQEAAPEPAESAGQDRDTQEPLKESEE